MSIKLFGFEIRPDKKSEKSEDNKQSFVQETQHDGAIEVNQGMAVGGSYGTYVDVSSAAQNQTALIMKYRQAELQPEVDRAVDDIVNEAVVLDENDTAIAINLDRTTDLSSQVKKAIREEFSNILSLLDFNNSGYDIFRRWYVDGMIYYHKIIDIEKPEEGIKELRYIDPRKIKKVRESKTDTDKRTGVTIYRKADEFFVFNPMGVDSGSEKHVKIAKDSIAYVPSGIVDPRNNTVVGHLHKALKFINTLRMVEDASVIYRLARAPERRIFYIDVGNMPKMKADQHLKDMMTKHKNKIVYDAETGTVRDDRKFMTMLEDFWLPRREGGRGTEITTLPGGDNLGEITDIEYFRRETLKALNVPIARMESETPFNVGRSSEVTRDEIKFSKFISRLRVKFSIIFDDILFTQLKLKNIINSREQWNKIREGIDYDFRVDNFYAELKEAEIFRERIALASEADPFVGKYFSINYVRKKILHQSDDDIEEIDSQIKDDAENDEDQFDIGMADHPGGVAPQLHKSR